MNVLIVEEDVDAIFLYCSKMLSHCEDTAQLRIELLPQNFFAAKLRLQILRGTCLTNMKNAEILTLRQSHRLFLKTFF